MQDTESNRRDSMDSKDLSYRQPIIDRLDRQTEKGIRKYGGTIDKSGHLKTVTDGLEYLAEELTDALVYIEFAKDLVRNTEREREVYGKSTRISQLALREISKGDGTAAKIAKKALQDMGLE